MILRPLVLALGFASLAFLPAPAFAAAAKAPAAAAPAEAALPVWTSGPGSTLTFESSYDGESFEGGFSDFRAEIAFDPARLSASRFDVRIALASANTENDERDETLHGAEFFNVAALSDARYTATAFRALPDGRFVADGELALNGAKQAVPLTFRWVGGASPRLEGTATLNRLAFNVGIGDWGDLEMMPDSVTVTTTLVLKPSR